MQCALQCRADAHVETITACCCMHMCICPYVCNQRPPRRTHTAQHTCMCTGPADSSRPRGDSQLCCSCPPAARTCTVQCLHRDPTRLRPNPEAHTQHTRWCTSAGERQPWPADRPRPPARTSPCITPSAPARCKQCIAWRWVRQGPSGAHVAAPLTAGAHLCQTFSPDPLPYHPLTHPVHRTVHPPALLQPH
jgi:hypothetical protein